MIASALREKLRTRGLLAFAADAAELTIACGVLVVCAAGVAAIDLLAWPRRRQQTEATSCRNAEEAPVYPLGHVFSSRLGGEFCSFIVDKDDRYYCGRRIEAHEATP
jgi:hypothetical protein